MSVLISRRSRAAAVTRRGVALLSVLYFLIVVGLTTTALFFSQHSAEGNRRSGVSGTKLLAAAESAAFSALDAWNRDARLQQSIGSTVTITGPTSNASVYITRLTMRVFSLVGVAAAGTGVVARRIALLVRIPIAAPPLSASLVSAVDVTIGPEVRFAIDTACSDSGSLAIIAAPSATITGDSPSYSLPPTITHSAAAEDSSVYLRFGDAWWDDVTARADIRFIGGAHVRAQPSIVGSNCTSDDANWGDPHSLPSPCGNRVPIIYASGDLTIDGGRGQGALLVDGRLVIAGPFEFSGQIVARAGIETRADNIAISGVVSAWHTRTNASESRAPTSDIVLTHATTFRYSRCDAWHGIASWQQPRLVRERAWSELF